MNSPVKPDDQSNQPQMPARRLSRLKVGVIGIPIILLIMASCQCAGTPPADGQCMTSPYQFIQSDSPTGYDCLMATVTANPAVVQCVLDQGDACKDDNNAPQCFSNCDKANGKANKSKELSTPFAPKVTPSATSGGFIVQPACVVKVGDGVCSACENTDLDSADCTCNMNGVCDPHEGFNCPDCAPTVQAGGGGGGGKKGFCGDGKCGGGENASNCAVDCHK